MLLLLLLLRSLLLLLLVLLMYASRAGVPQYMGMHSNTLERNQLYMYGNFLLLYILRHPNIQE